MSRLAVLAALGALAAAVPAAAQDTVRVGPVATTGSRSRVAQRAVDFFNTPGTTRVFGRLTIGPDDVYPDDVAIVDGPLRVEGVIEGDLVAINADVELAPGSEVGGDILVLGGTFERERRAVVRGTTRHHRSGVAVRRVGNRLELVDRVREPEERRRRPPRFRRRGWSRADASIVLGTGGTYNRVEGLPLLAGPRIRWGGYTGGQVQALGIFRTAGDFKGNREDIGYAVDGNFQVGYRDPIVTIGARAYDLVVPVEDWQLDDDEVGLAAFFLHRDYRDYFLRRGYAGYVAIEPFRGFRLTGEVARDEEQSVADRDPWTLFRGDDRWRKNPRIDEGDFTHVRASIEWDSRDGRSTHGSGWLVRAEWERGIADDNVIPRALPPNVRGGFRTNATYDRLFVDLRRYERIGWSGQLRFRAVGAGAVGDDPLPVQRRLSLGGPDPMPGYAFRRFTCGGTIFDPASTALCDRILLLQVEYRGDLLFGVFDHVFDEHPRRHHRGAKGGARDPQDWNDWWDWGWFWWDGPDIVLFGNAGTGWLRNEPRGDLQVDVGAGITFGSTGIYAAKALEDGEPIRVLFRLHARF